MDGADAAQERHLEAALRRDQDDRRRPARGGAGARRQVGRARRQMSKGRGPRGTGPPPRSGAPPAALAETLRKALALQQQGALAEAEALYKSVLARQPGNFDALHLMGVLELQRRRPDAAAALIGRALAANPKSAAAHG